MRAGLHVPVAMKITGHRTDSMFRRYAIVDEEQKREALAKTQAYLAAAQERKVVGIRARFAHKVKAAKPASDVSD